MPDNQAVAPTQRDLATMPIEQALDAYAPNFAAVLPPNISVDHFKRMVVTAINITPELMNADRRTLFNSCVKCASDGLLPDGREAALVIYNTKVKDRQGREQWIAAVQYMPMIAGIRKRLRNSGEVDSATAEVVRRKDKFKYVLGDGAFIEHEPPPLDEDRGDPIGAYAIIKLASGEVIREVMGLKEIEKSRAASRATGAGPWVTWWSEMARKTVMRRAAKAAPQAAMLEKLLLRDEETELPAPEDLPAIPARPQRAQFALPPLGASIVNDDGVVTEVPDEQAQPEEDAQVQPEEEGARGAPGEAEQVTPPHVEGFKTLAEALPPVVAEAGKREAIRKQLIAAEAAEAETAAEGGGGHAAAQGAGEAHPPSPAARITRRRYEIEPVMDEGKPDWRAWTIALFLPKLRQIKTADEMSDFVLDNGEHMIHAKAALGAEWPDAAIIAAWQKVGR